MTLSIPFTVPLTREVHQIASQLGSAQFNSQRAKQVYTKVLAVRAVRFYLTCMEIETEDAIEEHLSMPEFEDCSRLEISGLGTVECCPVLSGDKTVRIPAETWGDRIGYLAVRFDESFTHGNVIGFIKNTQTETIPLDQLDSLDQFLNYICDLEDAIEAQKSREPVKLFQWWNNTLEAGWETLESLFPRTELAWRHPDLSTHTSERSITRAKILNLATPDRIALAIEMVPMKDSETTNSEIEIWVKLYPLEPDTYLPENLRIAVLDETQSEVIQAEARTTENIRVKFVADTGESFGVRVALNEAIVTESFQV